MSKQSFTLLILLTLSGCAALGNLVTPNPQQKVCPPPVWADDKVGEELEDFTYEGHEDFWEWMSRVERLNEILDEGC